MYKAISKVLANHLKTVYRSVVYDVQSAYIARMNILYGPLITNEFLAWLKNSERMAMLFKVEFTKHFNH